MDLQTTSNCRMQQHWGRLQSSCRCCCWITVTAQAFGWTWFNPYSTTYHLVWQHWGNISLCQFPFSMLEQQHIEIDFQFVRDVVHNEQIHVKFLSTKRSDCWPANKTSGHTKVPPCPVQSQCQGTSLEVAGRVSNVHGNLHLGDYQKDKNIAEDYTITNP